MIGVFVLYFLFMPVVAYATDGDADASGVAEDGANATVEDGVDPADDADADTAEEIVTTGRPTFPALDSSMGVILTGDGEIMYEQNADAVISRADGATLMAAYVAIRNAHPTDPVVFNNAMRMAYSTRQKNLSMMEGESVTVGWLLRAMLLGNANDAAYALAIHVAGSVEGFTQLMNAAAETLGMTDTLYVDPYLTEGGTTSARDLSLLLDKVMQYSELYDVLSLARYILPATNSEDRPRYVYSSNALIEIYSDDRYVDPRIAGGFNVRNYGADTLLIFWQHEGTTLTLTLTDAPVSSDERVAYTSAKAICSYIADTYKRVPLVRRDEIVAQVPVINGAGKESVLLLSTQTYPYLIATGDDVTVEIEAQPLYAPVQRGTEAGTAHYYIDGKPITQIALVTADDVALDHVAMYTAFIMGGVERVAMSVVIRNIVIGLVVATVLLFAVRGIVTAVTQRRRKPSKAKTKAKRRRGNAKTQSENAQHTQSDARK